MHLGLLARGPITAISCLIASATFSAGVFFVAIRNTALDCSNGSATGAACGVDVIESVLSAVLVAGTVVGAAAVGLVTPTPRGLEQPVFRVDGKDMDWAEGMNSHHFGHNRTIDDPAIVEYQHNATSAVHKYISYKNEDNHLVIRHPTGVPFDFPHSGLLSRTTRCEAYIDTLIDYDSLRGSKLAWKPTQGQYAALATNLFNYFANHKKNSGCVALEGAGSRAVFEMGASCARTPPLSTTCLHTTYDVGVGTIRG